MIFSLIMLYTNRGNFNVIISHLQVCDVQRTLFYVIKLRLPAFTSVGTRTSDAVAPPAAPAACLITVTATLEITIANSEPFTY